MVNVIIDGIQIEVLEGTTILEAAKQAKINIPTLCYWKGLNEIGACRVCIVEVKGCDKLTAACNTPIEEGMEVYTNSPKVREARKTNVQLILSQHDCQCAYCIRSGNCALQKAANDLGIINIPFPKHLENRKWVKGFPLVKDFAKCIKCMRCVQACDKMQGLHIWDVANTGSRTTVDVSQNLKINEADCSLCGQCITHCPVGALHERDDISKVMQALADESKITVVQIAPAVRAAWGEALGLKKEQATIKRLAAVLRKMGFTYIFDTNFSADLTIMEEGSEFLKRYTEGKTKERPMFTSCCPGWVRFLKAKYPQYIDQLSTAKSPQQMFGAITKSYYADYLGIDPADIVCISIMPCLAKKMEADLPTMKDAMAGEGKDVDIVLTTRELDRLIKEEHIMPQELEEEELDLPLGIGSGAGVIFGATGGVMEAALRTAYYLVKKENPDPDAFKQVRGMDGWKEAEFKIEENCIKVAVVSGLANTDRLMKAIIQKEVQYDFVEVMACPGGCSGGGGQPILEGEELAKERADILYGLDKIDKIRFSHENPSVQECYEKYLQRPMSSRAHELLHTNHHGWKMPAEEKE